MVRSRAAVLVAGLAVAIAGCNSGAPDRPRSGDGETASATADPGASESPVGEPGMTPTANASAAPGTMTAAVYYLVDTKRGVRLQREFRQIPRTTTPVRSALEAMLHEPPLDRDYTSLWPRATQIRGIALDGATATVDLTRHALDGKGGAEATAMSLQQLVHTMTAADKAIADVRILVEGKEVDDFWGHESLAGRRMRRGPQTDVLAAINIDTPNETSTVGATFTISGTATVFEANVLWKVTRGCPADVTCVGEKPVYRSGFVTASNGAPARGTWSVEVTMPEEVFETAGYVEIVAFEESMEDGSELFSDTKVVRVVR